ncbi:MAG: DNA polymerase I, partial [Oscillospiraceae bacterium]|nr:DNA polymerase I [Oscillospiraceae bacterium]
EMSHTLAEISRSAPVDFTAEQARVREPDNDRLWEIFERLGFKKLEEAFSLRAPDPSEKPDAAPFTGECVSVEMTDDEALARFAEAIAGGLCGVRFSPDMERCYVNFDTTGFILREGSPVYAKAMEALCAGSVRKAGHGVKDAVRELCARGFPSEGWEFDTEIAAYLLDPLASRYDLGRLTERYAGFALAGETEEAEQLSLLSDDTRDTARYLSEAAAVLALREIFLKELEQKGLLRVFEEIEMPLVPVLADMERAGMLVDRQAIATFGALLSSEADRLQAEIWELAGGEFNILSPKQLGQVLFDKLLLPAPKKTKTGYSTSADVLEKLMHKHPIVPLVLDYRQLTKLKSTYCDGLLKVVGGDGRIHTNFQMTVTATGRLSSTEPNLQNIPVRRALGGEMREMFVAPEGQTLVDADYSQIELRLLAHISGDETMINAFKNGEDIHAVTASQVLGVPPSEVTPEQRRRAKAVNFGIVYGISVFSLAQDIGSTVQEAQRYMDGYLEKYAGVREYMKRVVSEAKQNGFVTTLYGRRRPLPEIASSNRSLAKFGERVALNAPIQGTAADIMKLAMIRAYALLKKEAPDARLIMQVHDELIAECPEAEAEQVKRLLTEAMEGAASLSVPLDVEASSGKSWYEAK